MSVLCLKLFFPLLHLSESLYSISPHLLLVPTLYTCPKAKRSTTESTIFKFINCGSVLKFYKLSVFYLDPLFFHYNTVNYFCPFCTLYLKNLYYFLLLS